MPQISRARQHNMQKCEWHVRVCVHTYAYMRTHRLTKYSFSCVQAIALFDYEAFESDELSFKAGNIITLIGLSQPGALTCVRVCGEFSLGICTLS
jgi:hypothetical protein